METGGNRKCIPCPRNSNVSRGQTKCPCRSGFFRFLGENYTQPCYGKASYNVWDISTSATFILAALCFVIFLNFFFT